MNDISVPIRRRALARADRPAVADRIARRLVLARLARLNALRLELHEPRAGVTELGPDDAPVARLDVHDPRFHRRIAAEGALGAARAYIEGLWDAPDLTRLLRLLLRNAEATDDLSRGSARLTRPLQRLLHHANRNTQTGSRRNIHAHYDLGNEFFRLFLDDTLTYSSAYFQRDDMTLAEASTAKLDRLCRSLDLRPEDHLLEIGTGWGSMALHAATHYGCRVTTTTISREQATLARRRVRDAGLDDRVTVLEEDYRGLAGTYDKLVSVEMIEAVGHEFLPAYFHACADRLKPDGVMAIQVITMPEHRYARYLRTVDFIRRYVFPGSCCPALSAVTAAAGRAGLRINDLHDLTDDYARTLRTWRGNFNARLDDVRELGFGEEFIRLWTYYLCYCEAGFAERYTGCLQLRLTRNGDHAATLNDRSAP